MNQWWVYCVASIALIALGLWIQYTSDRAETKFAREQYERAVGKHDIH